MRISGTEIPDNKKIEISLTYVYGIGRAKSVKILKSAKISLDKKASEISSEELNKLRIIIDKDPLVGGGLHRTITMNIKRLKDTGTYRGARHVRSLPVRGQRTKTNSRTRRGNVRRTMGSGKRKADKK